MAEARQIQCPHCGQPYSVMREQVPQYLGQTIVCQQCGRPFSVEGSFEELRSVPVQAPAAPGGRVQPVPYATPPGTPERTDGMSLAALITGVLALFIPIIAGVLAIIFGAIGLKRTADPRVGGRGFAIAGLTLGIVGLFMSICMVSILLPSLNRARETANRVKCANNMRQIGLAIVMYQSENRDYFPPDLETVLRTQDLTAEVFVCPSSNDRRAPGGTVEQQAQNLRAGPHLSYVYVPPTERGLDLADPGNTVILYEPLTNHARDGSNFLYADLSVQWHPRAQTERIVAGLNADSP